MLDDGWCMVRFRESGLDKVLSILYAATRKHEQQRR